MEQTGGIFYHYLALRNSVRYWRDYQVSIEAFLSEALDSQEKLLVGPSGGYSLSKCHFLQINSDDKIAELDPMARLLLKYKVKQKLDWINEDLFVIERDPSLSAKLSSTNFNHTVSKRMVFCNMLGQLAYQYPGYSEDYWLIFFNEFLAQLNAEIYSYHDRWTLIANKKTLDLFEREFKLLDFEQRAQLDLKNFSHSILKNLKTTSKKSFEILEHPTVKNDSLSLNLRAVASWRRTKNCLHLIHCISSANL